MSDPTEIDKIVIEQKASQFQKDQKKKEREEKRRKMKALLQRLAFQIFLLIADADGEIDTKEIGGFRKFLAEREKNCSSPYTQRIFHSTVINYTALLDSYNKKRLKKDFRRVEIAMLYAQKCLSKNKMEAFCHDLKELASAIAEASGGFMGMGNHVCKEEKYIMRQLTTLFEQSIEKASGPADRDVKMI